MTIRDLNKFLAPLLVYVTSAAPAYAAAATAATKEARARTAETRRILSVVERTVDNEQVVDRVRQKLSTLDDKRIRLLGTLAERLDTGRRTPRSDMALLLLVALIAFE
jgi:hypothetical protein